jgi:hypothetical protein
MGTLVLYSEHVAASEYPLLCCWRLDVWCCLCCRCITYFMIYFEINAGEHSGRNIEQLHSCLHANLHFCSCLRTPAWLKNTYAH